ncbi:type IV pilus assembly protein PilX [Halopseudomonas litoralis]|uniref:Type IV pilus assembly protein PilX n=1 Tax=Halopseudomonas litoralis TaxID=797277 RepID=A0A1H1L984_9GAMM|nr:PilX N-terminal domain-containing pilus assembly protein [Halopseudomonas litoralis]SDR71043.1 type IV pilus assembly protein PilX [Halopseudomonas litoralis]
MAYHDPQQAQAGSALIISMVFLLLMTVTALAGIRTSTGQERMAFNVKLKNDSFQAAESSMRHVEEQIRKSVLALPVVVCHQAACELPDAALDPDHRSAPGSAWNPVPAAVAGNDMAAWYRIVRLGDSAMPVNLLAEAPSTLYRISVVSHKGSTRTVLESIYAFTRI